MDYLKYKNREREAQKTKFEETVSENLMKHENLHQAILMLLNTSDLKKRSLKKIENIYYKN